MGIIQKPSVGLEFEKTRNFYLFWKTSQIKLNMKMRILYLLCVLSISVTSVISIPRRHVSIPAYPQQAVVPAYHQGLQYGDLGCCRSSFPDEYGSCRQRSHCVLPTQPYCSGYGYCIQSQDYGI